MERHKQYLDYINEQVTNYAKFDFEKRVDFCVPGQYDSIIPKLAESVNLLGEQLKNKVDELTKLNEELLQQKTS